MSLKSDAETVMSLSNQIVRFEIMRAKLVAANGAVQLDPDDPDTTVTLSAAQRASLLNLESNWISQIKGIVAGW